MLDDIICNNTGHRCLICDWSNLLSNNPGLNKMLHHSWAYSCHRFLDLSGYYNFQDIDLNLIDQNAFIISSSMTSFVIIQVTDV